MEFRSKIIADDLECLFRENYSHYYYFALNFVDDSETAKDVIGEVFLAVWRNHENISKDKLNSYIYSSIRNKCLTLLKQTRDLVNVDDQKALKIPDVTEEEWKLKEDRIIEMEKVVKEMNPKTRYILEQFYYHHRSYKDVASELGISTEGIKK